MKNTISFSKTLAFLVLMIVAVIGFGYANSSVKAENAVAPAAVTLVKSPSANPVFKNYSVSQKTPAFNLFASIADDQEMSPCEDTSNAENDLNLPADITTAKFAVKSSPPLSYLNYANYDDSPIIYQLFKQSTGARNRHIVRRE